MPNASYTVTTFDFLASGADLYSGFLDAEVIIAPRSRVRRAARGALRRRRDRWPRRRADASFRFAEALGQPCPGLAAVGRGLLHDSRAALLGIFVAREVGVESIAEPRHLVGAGRVVDEIGRLSRVGLEIVEFVAEPRIEGWIAPDQLPPSSATMRALPCSAKR